MRAIPRKVLPDLILIAAILFGVFVRFNPTISHGYPIGHGGMFAVMIDDLRANDYLLPRYTNYNHLNIPYAYPPLGFYLGGITADLFGWNADQILRWLPAFFSSLSILAFHLVALRLLKSRYQAAVSTLFFALMPRAFSWFVTGSGLTRAPGQLMMLLTLAAAIQLYVKNRPKDIWLMGLFGGLTVLSHPEAGFHTGISVLFLWVMLSRSYRGFINSLAVVGILFLVTAPWWATVLYSHGIGPLVNALQTGQKSWAVLNLLFFVFAEEPYATFIAILGLLGIAYSLPRRAYLLPLWLVIPFIVEGRSAAGPAAIPLAMLAAIGLLKVVMPPLLSMRPSDGGESDDKVPLFEVTLLVYLVLYLLLSAYQFGLQLPGTSLLESDRQAMEWVRRNTPKEARFLVLTGTTSVSCDSVLEWFPALTGRQSLYTVQGTEWTKGPNFNAYVLSTYGVQQCLFSNDPACLDAEVSASVYDFVYVSRMARDGACRPLGSQRTLPLLEHLRAVLELEAVYETDEVIIFNRR